MNANCPHCGGDISAAITEHQAKIGRIGRAKNTPAQQTASASNGKKGGRPINPNSKRQRKLAAK
jgi:hypothetical protein